MKYMKLGTRPDTFYTEEATRSVLSDVPSDLVIEINNIRYRLHKCGLLQRLCSNSDDSADAASPVALHDVPGGEDAFELCARFTYGITINLSAHNFVPAFCAAKFLRMTESVVRGNFVMKLEAFFDTCILRGWKDSIVTLQATRKLMGWSENLGIVHRCVEAIVGKILTHPSKVSWSYTYTRPGYSRKQHRSVPRDWWTEDVSDLDLDHFRTIISTIRSAKEIPPPLIGEALHVYACKHLPDASGAHTPGSSGAAADETPAKEHRRVLESIVSMIPIEDGSVSGGFLLRLLRVASLVGTSPSTKAELVRRSGLQLHEASAQDLLFPLSSNPSSYDVDLVAAVLENFLVQFRRPAQPGDDVQRAVGTVRRVAAVMDSYLQVIAQSADTPVSKFAELAGALPEVARPEHDGLYTAIDTYLKEHPELNKEEKRQLCRMVDCRKLSGDARSHAIKNDRLPLRTIVQLLFVEQERVAAGGASGSPRSDAAGDNSMLQRNVHEHAKPTSRGDPTEREGIRGRVTALGRSKSVAAGRTGKSRSGSEFRTGGREMEITEGGGGLADRFKPRRG